MPKCGIFINFVFCRQLLKNEIIPAEKKQKEDKAAVYVATLFLYVMTQNSSRPKELCRSQIIYVLAKASQNSRLKRAFEVATVKFSIATELEEDFEKSCRDNPEICCDIQGGNGEGIMSRHYFVCHNIKAEDQWMNSFTTRDNFVATKNIKKETQVN